MRNVEEGLVWITCPNTSAHERGSCTGDSHMIPNKRGKNGEELRQKIHRKIHRIARHGLGMVLCRRNSCSRQRRKMRNFLPKSGIAGKVGFKVQNQIF